MTPEELDEAMKAPQESKPPAYGIQVFDRILVQVVAKAHSGTTPKALVTRATAIFAERNKYLKEAKLRYELAKGHKKDGV